ncbi:hypothetical protein GGU10DRAFT_376663 [Lentinula aff. detonsa]|uniref:Uncharacterized protein n=1 Tax=Lentinula aff. detonsa TaxID=2804958 RepID=A0AA38KE16_9AGAR|nr:hypothetical protein GGU10DRAFT_376663 [Lentinula aff. detonsa]
MTSSDFDLGLDDLLPSSTPSRGPHAGDKRQSSQRDSDDEDFGPNTPAYPGTVNHNVVSAARRIATAKRFRPEQMTELDAFLNNSEILSKLEKIIVNQPAWEVTKQLKENIKHYVAAAILSTSLISFRSTKTAKLISQKLLDLNLDLPENFRHNAATVDKLEEAISEELTQRRESMKKEIRSSMSKNGGSNRWQRLPDNECSNIYELTRALVKNTRCSVTPELCARAAILRHAYQKNNGNDFWKQVDATIQELQRKGEGDKKMTAQWVKAMLDQDCKKFSNGINVDPGAQESQSELQTKMDQLIENSQLASSGQDNSADDVLGSADQNRQGDEQSHADGSRGASKASSAHSSPQPEDGDNGDGND